MPLCFLSVRPPPPGLIACHVSPVAVRPWPSASAPPQVPAALPSLSLSASSTPPPLTAPSTALTSNRAPGVRTSPISTVRSSSTRRRSSSRQLESQISLSTVAKLDCKDLLSSKAWHLEKALGYNFIPGTPRKLQKMKNALSSIRKAASSLVEGKTFSVPLLSACRFCEMWKGIQKCCRLLNPAWLRSQPLEAPTNGANVEAPEGIHCVSKRLPSLKIVTSEIDVALNEEFHVIPGPGEFRDQYFGTDD